MFDPYYRWFKIPAAKRPLTHYELLGVARTERNARVIEEAALVRSAQVRAFQLRYPEECTRVLNRIAQAMDTLLDPIRRQEYDTTLKTAMNFL